MNKKAAKEWILKQGYFYEEDSDDSIGVFKDKQCTDHVGFIWEDFTLSFGLRGIFTGTQIASLYAAIYAPEATPEEKLKQALIELGAVDDGGGDFTIEGVYVFVDVGGSENPLCTLHCDNYQQVPSQVLRLYADYLDEINEDITK